MTYTITAYYVGKLKAGHDVAFSVLAIQDSLEASRVAGNEDDAEASKLVIDESGVYGGHFIATKDGFNVEAAEVTKD